MGALMGVAEGVAVAESKGLGPLFRLGPDGNRIRCWWCWWWWRSGVIHQTATGFSRGVLDTCNAGFV